MGRGRGKGKKLTVVASNEEPGSGGEEPLPAYKRRGRPQKPLKDDIDDDEVEKIEEVEADKPKPANLNKEKKVTVVGENGKKRKRHSQAKDNQDSVKEENGVATKLSTDNIKSNGFRQNGSRRKSKPRRAAEAGVNCKFHHYREYTSTEALYAYLEQLFVDMLQNFLIRLPEAMFKEVAQSCVDECDNRLRLTLKFAEQVRPLEDKVQWSFPIDSNITSLITQTSTAAHDHNSTPVWGQCFCCCCP